ncbi:MAG TPA: hypothetical protein VJ890_25040 [Vineibacter sp.]|nr:hypothetical protein [Vineibacter sp.]
MRVALLTTFAASRKEPLAAALERIHASFLSAGLGEPTITFTLADAPVPGFVSSVERVLKRYPHLDRFTSTATALPGVVPPVRQISNGSISPAAGHPIDVQSLLAIATGVPKSFPFHSISIHLHAAAFGGAEKSSAAGGATPGVLIGDNWWVNGRQRSLMALTFVDADPAGKKLPAQPESVAAVLAACGKIKKTTQTPLAAASPRAAAPATPTPSEAAPTTSTPSPDTIAAVNAVVRDAKARFADIIARANLPHDLPSARDALATTALGETAGPLKPALVRAFAPLGYDCKSEAAGTFTLRRRTAGNLTVEIGLDIGTWSRSLLAMFRVHGLGFKSLLSLPPTRHAIDSGQYRIGGPERWQQIVDNLAALVAELDRSLVPAIEAAARPSPAWYRPTG